MNVKQSTRLQYEYKSGNDGGGGQDPVAQVKTLIEDIGASVGDLKTDFESRLTAMEAKMNRPGVFGGGGGVGRDDGDGDTGTIDLKMVAKGIRVLLGGDQRRANEIFTEAKAMQAGVDPEGGYFVVPQFSTAMTKVMAEISPLYRLARVVPITTGGSFEEVIDRDQAGAEWVGEASSRNETETPDVGKFTLALDEIMAQPKATQTLIDTASIDIMGWLQDKVSEAFALKEGQAFHDGNGVGKPRGILAYPTAATADATRAWGTLQHIATGASGAFPASSSSVNPADVLIDVVSSLKAQYRTGSVWLMNRLTAGACRKLKDADGRHVWQESLIAGQPSVMLGYPVIEDEAMPDISAGSLSIAFGNFARSYTIIEKPGVRFLVDPYTSKPHVKLYAFRRVSGAVNNTEGIKLLKFS